MNSSTTILLVIFALFVQLSQEGVIKVSHKKPIKIKIQAKPSVLIKKPLPLMLLKKPLPLLLLKHHNSKFRKGWPLSALFTFKAVKYAKLAFLTSLVKKRRRRSIEIPGKLFSAPSTRVWLDDQRQAALTAKSAGIPNPRSSGAFRLDLRTKANGTLPNTVTLKAEQYPLFAGASTALSISRDVPSESTESRPIAVGDFTKPKKKSEDSPTTSSALLQDTVDDFGNPGNASHDVNSGHFTRDTIIFFSARSDDEETFLRGILGRIANPINTGTSTDYSTTISMITDQDEQTSIDADKLDNTMSTTSQIEQTTTTGYSVPEWSKSTPNNDLITTTINPWTTAQYLSTNGPVGFLDTRFKNLSESSEESMTSPTQSDISEEVTILPSVYNPEFSNNSYAETLGYSSNSSILNFAVFNEISTTAEYDPVESMTESPVISIVTSVSELTTTGVRGPTVFINRPEIATTEGVTTEQSRMITNPVPVISVKTVPRNIVKLATAVTGHQRIVQYDSSSPKVSPGYASEKQNSSAWHASRPSVIGGFKFTTDPRGDLEQKSSNRSKEEYAENNSDLSDERDSISKLLAVGFKEVRPNQTPHMNEKPRDIWRNNENITTSVILTTEQLLQTTTSASDLQALSTGFASITTPMPRSRPALLEADVTKVLNEVHSFDNDQLQKTMRYPSIKHTDDIRNNSTNNKTQLDAPPQTTTNTSSLREVEISSPTPETRVVYNSQMTPTVEEVKTVKRKQPNSATRRPMRKVVKKIKKVSSQSSKNKTASHEIQDDDIDDIFKSLRANDQDGCIQRAICEYEAIKGMRKLSVTEESFVDLFGSSVVQPSEKDRHKDSYPFHRAAFIGDNFRDVALCSHTYRSCVMPPASLLSALSKNERQSDKTIMVPGPVTTMPSANPTDRYPNPNVGLSNGHNGVRNNNPPLIPSILPPGAVPASIPPNVNVRPGSRATQFPDGTLLIVEPPADDLPNLPIFSHPKLPLPPLPGQLPAALSDAPPIPIEQVILPPHPHVPAIFETEVTFSAGGKGLNEVLPKIPKVFDNGMKLAPQMVDLVSHLIKHDIRKSPKSKHNDFIRDIVKEVVIGHIHKQFHKPSITVKRPAAPPPAPKHPPTFPVAPPVIPKTTPRPPPTPAPPPPCSSPCCNCPPQIVKHIHNHYDKTTTTTTTTTRKPQKKIYVHKKEPFLVIEKEPFRLEIGR